MSLVANLDSKIFPFAQIRNFSLVAGHKKIQLSQIKFPGHIFFINIYILFQYIYIFDSFLNFVIVGAIPLKVLLTLINVDVEECKSGMFLADFTY